MVSSRLVVQYSNEPATGRQAQCRWPRACHSLSRVVSSYACLAPNLIVANNATTAAIHQFFQTNSSSSKPPAVPAYATAPQSQQNAFQQKPAPQRQDGQNQSMRQMNRPGPTQTSQSQSQGTQLMGM